MVYHYPNSKTAAAKKWPTTPVRDADLLRLLQTLDRIEGELGPLADALAQRLGLDTHESTQPYSSDEDTEDEELDLPKESGAQ